MKNNSAILGETQKKSKLKPGVKITNNFSEKYFQFTKDKGFAATPKKSHHLNKDITSPRDSRDWKNEATSSKKKIVSPYNTKSQKININMEIKNFNIFNAPN